MKVDFSDAQKGDWIVTPRGERLAQLGERASYYYIRTPFRLWSEKELNSLSLHIERYESRCIVTEHGNGFVVINARTSYPYCYASTRDKAERIAAILSEEDA